MGLSFYMCAPVYRIDTALPLGLGNIYCRIDALSETERIWQIKKTNRRTNHNPVCLSFSAHSGPLIKRSEVVKVCRATRDCGLRRFLCVACSALIYILVRKVIKVTTVSTYPRGMQMPPTAPRGPHCPPLVPCGRWLHPVDVREQRWQHFHDAALSRQCDKTRRQLHHVDRDASWRPARPMACRRAG